MITLKLVEWNDKYATYLWWWNGRHDQLLVGPAEHSYATGWTCLMVGKFDQWNLLEKQIFIRKHDDGEWYTAASVFNRRGHPLPLARQIDPSRCSCHFFDTVYQRWLSDLMLRDASPRPDGA